jgi:hypothetical protein
VKVWTKDSGIEISPAPEKGKLTIKVAPEARVGVHWIRLYDDEGATPLRPFLVGTLPEVLEVEPNDDPTRPQPLTGDALTVNGKLARSGDVDGFALALRKGQTLVAALEANRHLGAPMDGLLQVVSADNFVLAENDDAPDRDPLIVFPVPADGRYIVRAFAFPAEPDSSIRFSGGESYVYRLTLTTRGFLDHIYPLAISRAATGEPAALAVEVVGWNIPEPARWRAVNLEHESTLIDEATGRLVLDHPLLANAGALRVEPRATGVETEPNSLEQPQDLSLPVSISGRIDPPRDQDVYRFAAQKGEKWHIVVESRSLGQPLDAVLKVLDASGKVLSEVDDPGSRRRNTTRDPELTFTVPADGSYRIVVRDLHGRGSFRQVYLLTIAPPTADYTLTLAADQFTLPPKRGEVLKIPVTVVRDDGFGSSIEVSANGLPDGVTASPATSAPTGASAKSVTLELKAAPEQGPWSGRFRIVGRVKEGDEKPRAARAALVGSNAATEQIWLTVPKPPASAEGGSADKKSTPSGP